MLEQFSRLEMLIGKEKIEAKLEYINTQASSASEIIAHYLQYKKKKIDNIG